MAQEVSSSVEAKSSSSSLSLRSQGTSLRRKIAGSFTGIILLVGLLVLVIVYQLTGRALRSQLDRQALAIATNLSDAASGFIMGRNVLELNALTAKYARLDGVSYVFLEDAKGNIVANSLGTLPSELRPASSQELRQTEQKSLAFRGRPVQETRMPILEGRAGAAHVGIWGDIAESEIRSVLLPIVALIGLAVIAGITLSLLFARWIIQPILGLTLVADKISKGNLDTPVSIDSRDEIGELARSLERMRASLKAAMARLSRA
jgi:HAMP domain-containing protein